MNKKYNRTAWIWEGYCCNICGATIIVTANMVPSFIVDDKDYYAYCSNQECENNVGEMIYDQEEATFLEELPKEYKKNENK